MPAIPAALKDQWTAYAQSLRLWTVQFLVWLSEWTGFRTLRLHAQSELRYLRREVRGVLLARTVIEMINHPPQRRRKAKRAHARTAFRTARCFRRYVLRGVRLRTFDDAKHALEHLEAYVACCVANCREGMKGRRKVRRVKTRAVVAAARACVGVDDSS